jgi:hypothetical protein
VTRPLVITDCDEVLLHMVRHFRDWLGAEHAIDFALEGNPFRDSMRRRGSSEPLAEEEGWRLLEGFFDTEMKRQTPMEGAVAAITELQREADVVVLTNLRDRFGGSRRDQLLAFGIDAPVYTNQGPKGMALKRIVEELAPRRAVFIDDIAQHHASAADVLPTVGRLHFCGEPAIAPHIPCALQGGHAHARIDTWQEALPWLLQRLHGDEQ